MPFSNSAVDDLAGNRTGTELTAELTRRDVVTTGSIASTPNATFAFADQSRDRLPACRSQPGRVRPTARQDADAAVWHFSIGGI
jgi:hypothetical protein